MFNNHEVVRELKQIRFAVLSYISENMNDTFILKKVCSQECKATFTTNEGSKVKFEIYKRKGKINRLITHTIIEIEGQVVSKPFKINFHSNMGEPFNGTILIGRYGVSFWNISDVTRQTIIKPCRNILGKAVPMYSKKIMEKLLPLFENISQDMETMTPADEETKSNLKSPNYEEEKRKRYEEQREKVIKEWQEEQLLREKLLKEYELGVDLFYESSYAFLASIAEDDDDVLRRIFRP